MKPAPALAGALLGWAALGGLVAAGLVPVAAWLAAGGALLGIALLDALALRRRADPRLRRDLPAIVPVGVEREVLLHLRPADGTALVAEVHDLVPGDWPATGLPRRLRLVPGEETTLAYRVTPTARGAVHIPGCDLRLRSALGLWWRRRTLPLAQDLRVYPNFAPLARFALFSAEQASRVVGAHVRRNRGEGTEFQQLREYRTGDSLRQIDWKASQRTRKLVSREYQNERNQQALLLLDTGRRLLAKDDVLSHFDHVLDASLVLSYLALRQGDAVGLYAHGAATRWLAPRRGPGTVDLLLNTLYDLDAGPVATDYLAAATELGRLQQRRALVVLCTNVRDEDGEDLLAAVRQLRRRHLVCVASLRELALDRGLEAPVTDLGGALTAAALVQYLDSRRRAHEALRAQGVAVLDVTCAQLPAALVGHYLAIKREGRL